MTQKKGNPAIWPLTDRYLWLLRKQHDHFIGVRDVEIAAQQLSGKVRISIAWIQQTNPVSQLIAFSRELANARVVLGQQVFVLAPREKSTWASHDETAHNQEGSKCPCLNGTIPGEFRLTASASHATRKITKTATIQDSRVRLSSNLVRSSFDGTGKRLSFSDRPYGRAPSLRAFRL
ncbi:hypothetical protein ABVV53_03640 [Novosphingobium sp. RD2P27]|uniref:Uncharacterized protein n=1 Tax=Novosphingobium kalidii TaxID=3230299 RepID=A0ABV2CY71_9SPHN